MSFGFGLPVVACLITGHDWIYGDDIRICDTCGAKEGV